MPSRHWKNLERLLMWSAIACMVLSVANARAQSTDVESVIQAFHAAQNAGDLDAAIAMFADDAVATIQQDVHHGKTAIRQWLENDKSLNIHVEVLNLQVTGDTATWRARISVSVVPEPFELAARAVVRSGKIVSFAALPEQAVLPATGRGSMLGFTWAAIACLGLLGLGMTMRRRAE